jgi:putative transposase
MTTNYRRERHSVTDLNVHLVCVLKYRDEGLTKEAVDLIESVFNTVCTKMNLRLIEFSAEDDHVHALVEYPPKISVSQILNSLKGVSSRRYGQAGLRKPRDLPALWSPAYFATSVGGAPIEVLKEYIRNQDKPK